MNADSLTAELLDVAVFCVGSLLTRLDLGILDRVSKASKYNDEENGVFLVLEMRMKTKRNDLRGEENESR